MAGGQEHPAFHACCCVACREMKQSCKASYNGIAWDKIKEMVSMNNLEVGLSPLVPWIHPLALHADCCPHPFFWAGWEVAAFHPCPPLTQLAELDLWIWHSVAAQAWEVCMVGLSEHRQALNSSRWGLVISQAYLSCFFLHWFFWNMVLPAWKYTIPILQCCIVVLSTVSIPSCPLSYCPEHSPVPPRPPAG